MLPFFCVHLDPTSSICFFRLRKRSFGLFLIRIQIQDLNPDSNPDPKPDPNPKLTKGRIRIRNRIRNKSFGSATLDESYQVVKITVIYSGRGKCHAESLCRNTCISYFRHLEFRQEPNFFTAYHYVSWNRKKTSKVID